MATMFSDVRNKLRLLHQSYAFIHTHIDLDWNHRAPFRPILIKIFDFSLSLEIFHFSVPFAIDIFMMGHFIDTTFQKLM